MNMQSQKKYISKSKLLAISFLFILSVCIIALGIGFSIYSLMYQVSFKVLFTEIPGLVFGLTSIFLGIRYFFAVCHLQKEVLDRKSVV